MASVSTDTSSEEATIRQRRASFNDALVRRDMSAIDDMLHADYLVMPSFSTNCVDKVAVLDAYKSYFADPDFITFVRIPERVVLGTDRCLAAEIGNWDGRWRLDSEGNGSRSGVYLAEWLLSQQGWKLMRENYVLLKG